MSDENPSETRDAAMQAIARAVDAALKVEDMAAADGIPWSEARQFV